MFFSKVHSRKKTIYESQLAVYRTFGKQVWKITQPEITFTHINKSINASTRIPPGSSWYLQSTWHTDTFYAVFLQWWLVHEHILHAGSSSAEFHHGIANSFTLFANANPPLKIKAGKTQTDSDKSASLSKPQHGPSTASFILYTYHLKKACFCIPAGHSSCRIVWKTNSTPKVIINNRFSSME